MRRRWRWRGRDGGGIFRDLLRVRDWNRRKDAVESKTVLEEASDVGFRDKKLQDRVDSQTAGGLAQHG